MDSLPSLHGMESDKQHSSETLLEQIGGWRGLVYSTLPVVIFVPTNALWGLKFAVIASLLVAVAVLFLRLVRREKLLPAISGFFAVALCAFIAYRMGAAKGYYLWGIWISAVYAGLALISIIVRWPIVGVLWNLLNGSGQHWRESKTARRWYSYATIMWAVVFAARFVTQQWLYNMDQATVLGIVRIAMGWPLTLLALVGTIWAVKKTRPVVTNRS